MPLLSEVLERLQLSQYLQVLNDNGFTTWETVLDITEEDLQELDFKLGHRRLLQREIATFRGHASYLALRSESTEGQSPQKETPTESTCSDQVLPSGEPQQRLVERREKRKYRWHPRPDENAPKRPKTAYVNFSDHLRNDPSISSLSFVEIAREVGRRWQGLDPDEKHKWEREAAHAMQKWEEQMEAYKRTSAYQMYQNYLEQFKKTPGKATRQRGVASQAQESRSTTQTLDFHGSPNSARSASETTSPGYYSSPGRSDEVEHALEKAMAEINLVKQSYCDIETYSPANPPPEERAGTGVSYFVLGTKSLIHTWRLEQVDEVLGRVYSRGAKPDHMSVAEVCATGSVGLLFTAERNPLPDMRVFYASAITNVDVLAEPDSLRVARLLLNMAVCAIIEKQMVARYMVVAGLKLARWKYPQLSPRDKTRGDWQGVYRSLIFVDCWLAYTLGLPPERTPADVDNALVAPGTEVNLDVRIQHHATTVALLAADISHVISAGSLLSAHDIKLYADKLDSWQPPLFHVSVCATRIRR